MKLRFVDDENRHEYWLDGKRAKGVTTAAKIPDDTYNLHQWERRQDAIGFAMDPDLVQAVAAHVEDKEILNNLCAQAKERAKANRGARRGTAAHRITELHDEGKEVIPTELATSVLAGWTEIMDACGFEIVPDLMERIVVYPDIRLCGKFDRIVRTRKGRLVMLDLKSGESALRYPHAIAIQLALYVNAPLLAGVLNERGETTEFGPMPELDHKWGVVIHLPEDGHAQAVKIDIEAGWKAARELVFPTMKWREMRARQLVQPLAVVQPTPAVTLDEGEMIDDATIEALRDDFKRCEGRIMVNRWIAEAVAAGRSFNIAGPGCTPTVRRLEIIRAAMAWASQPEDVVHAALNYATGQTLEPTPIGPRLGLLTAEEAMNLVILATDLDLGNARLTFSDDGTPAVGYPQPTTAA